MALNRGIGIGGYTGGRGFSTFDLTGQFTGGGGGVSFGTPSAPTAADQASKDLTPIGVKGMSAPGQDPYSQSLKEMMTGKFSPSDPSYQWRLNQGQQALERSGAAKGLLGSGNIATALMEYGQGAASQEYQAQFQRMLQASQNATSQYDVAIKGLAEMAGVNVAAGHLGLAQSKFSYQKQQDTATEQGLADALAQMSWGGGTQQVMGGPQTASQSDLYTTAYSYPATTYSEPSSNFMGAPSGTGWWSSSSGSSGSLGDTGGSSGFEGS